jgi:hypothetical protein
LSALTTIRQHHQTATGLDQVSQLRLIAIFYRAILCPLGLSPACCRVLCRQRVLPHRIWCHCVLATMTHVTKAYVIKLLQD